VVPVMCSPRQLRQIAGQLQAKGFPRVVFVTNRECARIENIIAKFGPSKYLEEFYDNPLNDCLKAHYDIVVNEDPVIIFERKAAEARDAGK